MTSKPIERRSFIKMMAMGIGASCAAIPFYSQAIDVESTLSLLKFRLGKPEWILHEDGTFDLVAGDIRLRKCRPMIDGQSIFVRNAYLGDSPKGKRLIYQLKEGFVMLDLKVNSGSVSIGAEISGMSRAPYWFCPLGEAKIEGATRFFKQAYGTGGGSGVFEFPKATKQKYEHSLGEQAWSYDSYVTSALISDTDETIAFGCYEQQNFIQRSTIYNKPHRKGLNDSLPDKENLFFETGFVMENIPLTDLIKLPDIFIYNGNQPFETLRHLAWNISESIGARKDSITSYHWSSNEATIPGFNYDDLINQLQALDEINPKIPFHTIQIDKGYCIYGDWLEPNEKWPKGMEVAAREVFRRGYRAGIWIAPFVVHEESKVFRRHKNWLIQDLNGEPIVEKQTEAGKLYALDGSHPDVKRYIQRVFRTYRKMGYTFYKTDYMDCGLKANSGIKRYDKLKTSVQIYTDVLKIIREEIGAGSIWLSGNSPYGPMIGYVDAMSIGGDCCNPHKENWISNVMDESYHTQYFNNVFWQNDLNLVQFKDEDLKNFESSLSHWAGMLGGVVSTSEKFSEWTEEQIKEWRFLQPKERPQSASMPLWGSSSKCKMAIRRYKDPRSWGILVINNSNETVQETYSINDLTGQKHSWVYLWEAGKSSGLGDLSEITVTLRPKESRLMFLTNGKTNPPEDFTISGISLDKFNKRLSKED